MDLVSDLTCHRCAGELVCAARVPHSFARADGHRVTGSRTVGLCPRCDRDSPAAAAVIAYFTAHGTARADTVGDLAVALRAWLTQSTVE
ncbi:DUF6300 family protein [Actinokineospora auranticolor]|uniref:DUF6300 family protein n=1 Tax=Actinokineospora auranticolor TaxID=155976 RepID=UPI000CEC86E9|nr:DUF6300 family protein [Actinokineospora auranticolor]